jgi:hypothetical protein
MFEIFLAYLLMGSGIAMALYIWLNTNAFSEYLNLFGFHDMFGVEEYNVATKDDPTTSYTDYIAANKTGFFARLVTCPKCLSVWLSGFFNLGVFAVLNVLSIWLVWALYPLSVLITSYFSLVLYGLLVKMIK